MQELRCGIYATKMYLTIAKSDARLHKPCITASKMEMDVNGTCFVSQPPLPDTFQKASVNFGTRLFTVGKREAVSNLLATVSTFHIREGNKV